MIVSRLRPSCVAAVAATALLGPVASFAQTASPATLPSLGQVSFADVFARVAPAVVSITVVEPAPASRQVSAEDLPFPFNQLPQFQNPGRPGGRAKPAPRGGSGAAPDSKPDPDAEGQDAGPEAEAAGSGFLITADGYIVTNNHVVEDATKITITFSDGREIPARLIGRDPATDLAVVKVEGTGFAHVGFETQVRPRVGDWVMAVGNPLQLGGTATAGIVSYVGREVTDLSTPLTDFLQISAPITFGNSGGPTFDLLGRVVGVNAAIAAQGGAGGGGIGFAIPADVADGVVKQLMTGSPIKRGYLGASIQGLDAERAAALGLPPRTGALIAQLTPGGPGAVAGLRVGDLVLSLNGQKVSSSSELTRLVTQVPVGATFHLGVRRQGRDVDISVRAGVRPTEDQLAAAAQDGADANEDTKRPGVPAPKPGVIGITAAALSPTLRDQRGLGLEVRGLLIEAVQPNSDAARKGLRAGDVIVQANQQPLSTPADFASQVEVVRREGRPAIFLLVLRDAQVVGLAVSLASPPPAKPAK
jgi:serine protease Do